MMETKQPSVLQEAFIKYIEEKLSILNQVHHSYTTTKTEVSDLVKGIIGDCLENRISDMQDILDTYKKINQV